MAALTAATAHHWRTIRARLALAGIPDPLNTLPDMHALLDVTEDVLTSSMDAAEVSKLHTSLYRPEPGQQFDPEESDESFDAFMGATSGFR